MVEHAIKLVDRVRTKRVTHLGAHVKATRTVASLTWRW